MATKTKVLLVLVTSAVLAFLLFLAENVLGNDENIITRNTYGEGSKTEEYELRIEDEPESESLQIEVEERAYTGEEITELFEEVSIKLDEVILGENESFDRVNQDLNLVNTLEEYPVSIEWELDSYKVMNLDGTLRTDQLKEQGSMVELRGIIGYLDQQVIYVRTAMVYPEAKEGMEKLLYEIQMAVEDAESSTRADVSFALPKEVNGKSLTWSGKKSTNGYYVLFLGIMVSVFLVYREKDQIKREEEKRRNQLLREYPGMVTKMNMLLGTGMTVRAAWEKIVQQYELQKEQLGIQLVYEEMSNTVREIKGGISEVEAYERFGKRCELTAYLKFGAMLSQNLRKGSRGISELLRVEAIQSFENRKSLAKKLGEEAGTKLMIPMMGLLAVVMIMVMVPAFLAMQL